MNNVRMIPWLAIVALAAACGDARNAGPGDLGGDGSPIDASCMPPCADAGGPDAPGPSPDATPDAMPDAPAITGSALQLNDVSIMLPLPITLADRDDGMLSASATGDRGALLPRAIYDEINAEVSFSFEVPFDQLRVVALRIDPCFAQTHPAPDGTGCEAQLRLVLQPIPATTNNAGELEAADAAVHTFYRLTRTELYALKGAIVALRLANSTGEALGPLARHPVVVQQGLGGAFSAGLRALVLDAAGSGNLTRVATLHRTASQTWAFTIFDIAPTEPAEISRRVIATLPVGTTAQSVTAFNIGALDLGFQPSASGPDTFNELAGTTLALNLDEATRRAQFDALMRVENPHSNTPDTVACAGCHVAMIVKKRIAQARFGLEDSQSADAYVPAAAVVAPADLRPTFSRTTLDFNLHAFSYLGSDLAIVQRTVNESAAVLQYFATAPTP